MSASCNHSRSGRRRTIASISCNVLIIQGSQIGTWVLFGTGRRWVRRVQSAFGRAPFGKPSDELQARLVNFQGMSLSVSPGSTSALLVRGKRDENYHHDNDNQ